MDKMRRGDIRSAHENIKELKNILTYVLKFCFFMKIGIDARMYGAKQSGIGNYIRYLTDALFSVDSKNEYIMFMREPEFSRYEILDRRVKKILSPPKWYSWSEQINMPKILAKEKCDLIHFPHFNSPILYRGNSVVTIHDIIPFYYPGYKAEKSIIRRLGYKYVFHNSIHHAKNVISVSEHTKKDIVNLSGVSEKKINVIYLGVDQKFYQKPKEAEIYRIKQKYGIKNPAILYVGIWRSHKNVPGVIRAFNEFRRKYKTKAHLILGGEYDPGYPESMREINASPYKSDIIRIGFIQEADLVPLYYASDALLHLSLYEGNALTCLEAIAANTPVIASKMTAIPEILGDAALYCNPRDPVEAAEKIYRLLNDKELYKKMQEKGVKKASEYDWKRTANETLRVYEEAV